MYKANYNTFTVLCMLIGAMYAQFTCQSGSYLVENGCISCDESGVYCPGDDMAYECDENYGYEGSEACPDPRFMEDEVDPTPSNGHTLIQAKSVLDGVKWLYIVCFIFSVSVIGLQRVADKIKVIPKTTKLTFKNLLMSPSIRSFTETSLSQNFWVMFSSLQLLNCVLLLKIDISTNVVDFCKPINALLLHLDFLNKNLDSFNYDVGQVIGADEQSEAYFRMQLLGFNGSAFLQNYFLVICFLIAFSICHFAVWMCSRVWTNIALKMLTKVFNSRTYILFSIYSTLPVTIAIVSQMRDFDQEKPAAFVSLMVALFLILLGSLFITFIVWHLVSTVKHIRGVQQNAVSFVTEGPLGVLYEGLSTLDYKLSYSQNLVLKSALLGVILMGVSQYKVAQVGFVIFICLLSLVYAIIARPFESKVTNIFYILNEVALLAIYTIIGLEISINSTNDMAIYFMCTHVCLLVLFMATCFGFVVRKIWNNIQLRYTPDPNMTTGDVVDGCRKPDRTIHSVSNSHEETNEQNINYVSMGVRIELPPIRISPDHTLPPQDPDFSDLDYNVNDLPNNQV